MGNRGHAHRGRRDQNEPLLVDALERTGWVVEKLDIPTDLVISRRGVVAFVDVKNPEKVPSARKLTTVQVEFATRWQGHVFVIETIEDVAALNKWGGEERAYPEHLRMTTWAPKKRET